jgi:1,4-alpha-glucan branching enzyme
MDPLYWNAPRTAVNVGMSIRLAPSRGDPDPIEVTAVAAGRVTFTLRSEDAARAPSVGGDFNGWRPVPMTRSGDSWTATLPVPAGHHHYAFRSADGRWFVPSWITPAFDDGFGGRTALLIVG